MSVASQQIESFTLVDDEKCFVADVDTEMILDGGMFEVALSVGGSDEDVYESEVPYIQSFEGGHFVADGGRGESGNVEVVDYPDGEDYVVVAIDAHGFVSSTELDSSEPTIRSQ